MTIENEERLILEHIIAVREAEAAAKKAHILATQKLNAAKKNVENAERAAIDYMLGNGLLECDSFKLTTSYRVDVADINAVPEAYIRTKITEEVDKAKIRAMRPAGNFYVMTENHSIKTIGG